MGLTVRFAVVLVFLAALPLLSGCGGSGSVPTASSSSEASPTEGAASVGVFLRDDERFETLVELMSARDVPGHDATFIEVIDLEADRAPCSRRPMPLSKPWVPER